MQRLRWVRILLGLGLLLVSGSGARGANPASWNIVEQINRGDTSRSWTSPSAIDLGKMIWRYDYRITKVTGTVQLLFGSTTQDVTSLVPADVRSSIGTTRTLPLVLINEAFTVPETGTSADLFVEVDAQGFAQARFTNINLGSIDIPLLGSRPIQRINLEATVRVEGFAFGDYTLDGVIDAADYTSWKTQFGAAGELVSDGNGDGLVDAADYTVWRDSLSNSAGAARAADSPNAAPVPEPGSCVLGLGATLLVVASMRWRLPTGS